MQYRVSGPDISQGARDRAEAGAVVAANPQTVNINFDWMEPARQLRIRIDQDEARLLGLSSQAVARILNTVISGIPVTQVRDDIYLVDVVVRATDEQRVSLDTLRTLQVPLPGGRTVPLSQFATFEYEQEYPLVWRRDRVPTLTVQADITPGHPAGRGRHCARTPHRGTVARRCRAGYAIAVGGTVEESAKSQASVIAVVPVMLLIMLTVLMFQLQSFQRLFIVLSVGSAGPDRRRRGAAAVGQAAGLRRHSRHPRAARHDHQECRDPDRPDRCRARAGQGRAGLPRSTPAARASGPIMLTAISTVLGMIPIAPTVFWGPMAFAIMGGLAGRDDPDADLPADALRDLVRLAVRESRGRTGPAKAPAPSDLRAGEKEGEPADVH